ncbi:MAG TPA: hypothetical protein VNT54_12630 [Solirubrobacteraceae bacterium]|nr:hypothetical protein [Solirubrobacteraceae bacterium]
MPIAEDLVARPSGRIAEGAVGIGEQTAFVATGLCCEFSGATQVGAS